MTAPAASVAAVQKALGCKRRVSVTIEWCTTHDGDDVVGAYWTDRGCPVAVAAADAAVQAATPGIQAGALREAARDLHFCAECADMLDVLADWIEADHE